MTVIKNMYFTNKIITIQSAAVYCHPAIQRGLPSRHVDNFRARIDVTMSDTNLLSLNNEGRSDGGYIGIYTPKSVYLKFFMWLFCLLAMTS